MNTRLHTFVLPLVLSAAAFAQDRGMPGPAAELQKLAPMIGSWQGTGDWVSPDGSKIPWQAHGTYRRCLNDHFVREDFKIAFEGNPVPMVFRAYLGWDRENSRYVTAVASNGGETRLHEFELLPDGTMLQMMMQQQQGMPYAERARTKVSGDTMAMTIDLLMAEGASMQIIDGKLQRTDQTFDGDFEAGGWMGAEPHAEVEKLARMAGVYELDGKMVMAPGQPEARVTGTDAFDDVWGGTVVMGRTDGEAEGMPGKYESHAFWTHDPRNDCLNAVYVDNMGQVGEMLMRWSGDKLVSYSAGVQMGEPTLQRFVLEFDENGHCTAGTGHTIMGTMDPFVSFRAKYTRKKNAALR